MMSMSAQEEENVKSALQILHRESTTSGEKINALHTLATSSRTQISTRQLLADSEVLQILTGLIGDGAQDSEEITELALRCAGNACIDDDDARTAIEQLGFVWAVNCLKSDEETLKWLAVKVLYNICSDHDGAQRQCYRDRVHYPLIDLCTLDTGELYSQERSLLVDLLFWITGQRAEALSGTTEEFPASTLHRLIALPYHAPTSDIEDYATLMEICLTYFRDAQAQDQLVQAQLVAGVWQIFIDCDEREQMADRTSQEASEILRPISSSLIWCLSDIAANDDFSQKYSLQDPFIVYLCTITKKGGALPSGLPAAVISGLECQSAGLGAAVKPSRDRSSVGDDIQAGPRQMAGACQVLGNLIRNIDEEAVSALVFQQRLHEKLWRLLASPGELEDIDVTHSIAGFLVQLSRPSAEVREILAGDESANEALSRLCRHQMPQLKDDGMRLLRALGKESRVNQERFHALAASLAPKESGQDISMDDAPA